MKKKGKLFIISGPSGVGKSSILQEILKDQNNVFSISCTTRQKRNTEIDRKDYFFITKDEFEQKIKNLEFLEWEEVYQNYYGTPREWVEKTLKSGKNVILDIDTKGAENLQKIIDYGVYIFIAPPSLEELEKRIKNRNTESLESLEIRLKTAKTELSKINLYHYVVKNDILNTSIKILKDIISKENQK